MSKKKGAVHFTDGSAYYKDNKGNRVGVKSLLDAFEQESKCFGPNPCENTFTLPINDGAGSGEFPAKFQFVKVGTDVVLRITTDFGSGPETREVTLT